MAELLSDPVRRHILLNGVVTYLAKNKFQGAVVDFESLPQSAYPDLATFLGYVAADDFAAELRAHLAACGPCAEDFAGLLMAAASD